MIQKIKNMKTAQNYLNQTEIAQAYKSAKDCEIALELIANADNLSIKTQKGKSKITMDIEPMGIENGRRNGKVWIKGVIEYLDTLLKIEELEKSQNNE